MAIAVYLLKTIVVFATLFSLYNIFLKDVTFLRLRRWYLYATLVLTFLIPWISPHLLLHNYQSGPHPFWVWLDDTAHNLVATSWLVGSWGNHLVTVLIVITLATCFVLVTTRYLINLIAIYRFLKNSTILSKSGQFTIRTGSKGKGSFCFLRTIYLHSPSLSTENIEVILEHEKAHIRQYHYIDIWLVSMCDYLFWLYPFLRHFQKAWEETLECLADREAIQVLQLKPVTYQTILYSSLEYSTMTPLFNNAFGRSLIAQRLLFLSKKPSCRKRTSLQVFLPFILICILTAGLAFIDKKISLLQKINHIREAGFDLNEVTTGYVLDNKTGKSVSNAIVRIGKGGAVATTGDDGFFFIEKEKQSKINVQHIAYNGKQTEGTEDLIIRIEPSLYPVAGGQYQQNQYVRKLGTMAASFSSGHTGYQEYISKNMQYPEKALINKINGTVWVTAEIDVNGNVQKVQLQRGVNQDLNDEAIRLVKNMPKWNPALQNNIRTKVQVLMPIAFAQ